MFGAIFGDITGSVYEWHNTKDYSFRLLCEASGPTDDTCMTLAAAQALMETCGKSDKEILDALVKRMQEMGRLYPHAGYGGMFARWLRSACPKPYGSYGNGSAMRVSAAGWLYETLEETLHAARLTAMVTHDHPEGIRGAQAIAACIFMARNGASKETIREYVEKTFDYDLHRSLSVIRPVYTFDVTCQGSVPEAILSFLEGEDYEDTIRKAVSLGGDSDTIACMAGGIAEAFFGMPEEFRQEVINRLDSYRRQILADFVDFCPAYRETI